MPYSSSTLAADFFLKIRVIDFDHIGNINLKGTDTGYFIDEHAFLFPIKSTPDPELNTK